MTAVSHQMLATALRDLQLAAERVATEGTPWSRRSFTQTSEAVDALLNAYVEQEGDILPEYLPGIRPDAGYRVDTARAEAKVALARAQAVRLDR